MKKNNKQKLYESIMQEVSKVVKKHLDEDYTAILNDKGYYEHHDNVTDAIFGIFKNYEKSYKCIFNKSKKRDYVYVEDFDGNYVSVLTIFNEDEIIELNSNDIKHFFNYKVVKLIYSIADEYGYEIEEL